MGEPFTYESYLDRYGQLTYRVVGTSMLPLLKENRDLFTVRKKNPGERFRVGDVVLYRRGDSYVLHRILKVLPDGGYVILGDNCVNREYGTRDEDILGVMTGFQRKGRNYTVQNLRYRLHSRWRVLTTPVRIPMKKLTSALKRKIRK